MTALAPRVLRQRVLPVAAAICIAIVGTLFAGAGSGALAANILETSNERILLETDHGVLLRLDRAAVDIFIANPAIADIQVKSPRIVYIFGRSAGETTLYALDANENVIYSTNIAVTQNLSRLNSTIDELLPDADIDVQSIGGMMILTGFANTPEEAEVAVSMAKQAMRGSGSGSSRGGSGGRAGAQVINRIKIATPTQVNLQVKIAEVGRSTLKQLGFNWENSFFSGNALLGMSTGANVFDIVEDPFTGLPLREFQVNNAGTNSLIGSLTGGRFDINTVVDALEGEGFLSILAEPNLTALSGETASFLAGGEFPVPVPDGQGNFALEFKEFGIGLQFRPTVLSEGKIILQVAPEVSQISNVGAISINGISVPAISTRRVETTVELGSGQTFAIAGLLQNTITQDVSKFPGLADIPILGALFKSDRFQKSETELVIIVTPYIVRPVDAKRIALPTDGVRPANDLARYLKGETFTAQARPGATPAETGNGVMLAGGAGFRLKK